MIFPPDPPAARPPASPPPLPLPLTLTFCFTGTDKVRKLALSKCQNPEPGLAELAAMISVVVTPEKQLHRTVRVPYLLINSAPAHLGRTCWFVGVLNLRRYLFLGWGRFCTGSSGENRERVVLRWPDTR